MLVRGLQLAAALAALLLVGTGSVRGLPNASAQGDTQGDVTCDSTVNSIDSIQILRSVAGFSTSAACLAHAGDVNCDGSVNSVDSLRILRYGAGLTDTTPDGCVPVGAALQSPPTSEELIAAALERGDILYEESLRYRALALYDLPGLPEEYRSPVIDWHAGGELSTEIEENRASLSQELLDEIAPILARPNDPISIFNNPPQREGLRAPAAVPAGWRRSPAAGGAVYAWIREGPGADGQLASNVAAIGRVWNALPGIFRYGLPDTAGNPNIDVNPTPAIDIYFVDHDAVDPRNSGCGAVPTPPECRFSGNGLTAADAPNVGRTWSSYIQISTFRQGDDLLDTLAHELGHSGQFAYDAYEASWLKEATSTWIEFRALQKLGARQGYTYERLTEFYAGLHEPLTRDDGLNHYGAWLFFFFASMEAGDGIVTSIWQDAARPGKQNEDAVDVVFPFEEKFDEFTVRNWNQDPVDPLYSDGDFTTAPRGDPTFPPGLKPGVNVDKELRPGEDEEITNTPVALSALYYRYTFKDAVRKIKFTNEVSANRDAHIWAIPKVGEEWQEPEDWSREQEVGYCRDNPEEDLTEVIIILSNSHKRDNLPGGTKLKVEPEASACDGWEADVLMVATKPASEFSSWNGTLTARATIRFEPTEQLELCAPEAICWLPVSGVMDWSESGMWDDCSTSGWGRSTEATGYLNGKLDIWYMRNGQSQGQPQYSGFANFDYRGGHNEVTCPDREGWENDYPYFSPWKTMAIAPWDCDGHPEFRLADPAAMAAGGFCTLNQPGEQEHTATWTWTLRKAP